MNGTDGAVRSAEKPCPVCGVVPRPGDRRCEFCGRKIPSEPAPPQPAAAGRKGRGGAARLAVDALKAVGVGCIILGLFISVGGRIGDRAASTPRPSDKPDAKSQAYAACETHIAEQVRAPLSVKSFRPGLVAQERGGYTVTGTVELQSAAGTPHWKRFRCRVRPGDAAGIVIEEGVVY